jgi:hypothetical protein
MIERIRNIYGQWRRRRDMRGLRGPDFAVGDDAVVVGSGIWTKYETGEFDPGPDKGTICKVVDIGMTPWDCQLIRIRGWDGCWFTACSFRKLVRDEREAHDECPELLKILKKKPEYAT